MGAASAILALGAAPARAADPQPAAARNLIQHALHDAFTAFAGPRKSHEERQRLAAEVVQRYADLSLIAADILGSYWTKATPDQQRKFMGLLVEYGLSVWARPVRGVASGEQEVRVTGTAPAGHDVIVHTLAGTSGDQVPIDWTVSAEPNGRLVITNVTAENVSFITTMRDDFTSYLHRHGGGLDGLMAAMRTKIDTAVASAE